MALLLTLSLAGCGTTKLDTSNEKKELQKTESQKEWIEEEFVEADEEYFEVEDAKEKEADYSKYEEKSVKREVSGVVKYSDGKQKGQDKYHTDPVPEGKQNPVEPENVQIDKTEKKTCYLTVSCKTVLNNMADLKEGKQSVVPSNGIIYGRKEVVFYEGESVFDVLQREIKKSKIHMDYSFSPLYNSNYIKGIHNLYERDCGDTSGWLYCVNGWYPNYGCNRYVVQDKDEIEWNYTCDGGNDLGKSWMD